jgi:hypothetical protein
MEELSTQWEAFKSNIDAKLEEVKTERAKLEEEMAAFVGMQEKIATVHFSSTIKLDVGGHQFKTTVATLTKEPSMLASMFSGRGFKVEKDEDGFYFIDRPGVHFAPILHYLQTGSFIAPSDPQKLKAIAMEVDFYQIGSLLDIIRPKRKTFTYSNVNDTNGIFYWLGTNRGTSNYVHPLPGVVIDCDNNNNRHYLCQNVSVGARESGGCSLLNRPLVVHLPVQVAPSGYALSWSNSCHSPYNWKLEGCPKDSQEWVVLYTHTNASLSARQYWPINSPKDKQFSNFRLVSTGVDTSGSTCYCFHVACFELYGDVLNP